MASSSRDILSRIITDNNRRDCTHARLTFCCERDKICGILFLFYFFLRVFSLQKLSKDFIVSKIFQKLTPPPRLVTFSTQLVLLLRYDATVNFGWVFACFGMLFCILFIPMGLSALPDVTHRNFTPAGKGEVIAVEETNCTIGDVKVYRFLFKLHGENEASKENASVIAQSTMPCCYFVGKRYNHGDEVEIERCGDVLRIKGASLTQMGGSFLTVAFLPVIFPAIGMLLVLRGAAAGNKAIELLRDGEIGQARFVEMNPSGESLNKHPVMKLHYKFTATDGIVYDAYAKALDTHRLTDDTAEPLLYDVMNPARSVLLDSLPAGVTFDELHGTFWINPLKAIVPTFFCVLFFAELCVCIYAILVGGLLPI